MAVNSVCVRGGEGGMRRGGGRIQRGGEVGVVSVGEMNRGGGGRDGVSVRYLRCRLVKWAWRASTGSRSCRRCDLAALD